MDLRIAMLAPVAWRVPPRHYGPWELFVSLLTEGLVERGVDVTATIKIGLPVCEAANGRGIAVTKVTGKPGLAVVYTP